jgi:hypothetical protein
VKERPIIFSGETVWAILDGRKTMTRRVVKPQPDLSALKPEYRDLQFEFRRMPVLGPTHIPSEWGFCAKYDKPNFVPIYGYRCPYGQPGDRLWVRENLEKHRLPGVTLTNGRKIPGGSFAFYRADRKQCRVGGAGIKEGLEWGWEKDVLSSIFMPRIASRISLEITDVRVERLQEISPSDCEAEGITGESHESPVRGQPYEEYRNGDGLVYGEPIDAFAALWDSINGNKPGRSWADNPWVWVISFKRIGG